MKAWEPDQRHNCRQCLDDPHGWIVLECPNETCGRSNGGDVLHRPHNFAVRCPHWLKEHATALSESARKAVEKGKTPSQAAYDSIDAVNGTYRWQHAKTERARWAENWERTRVDHFDGAA